MWVYIFIIVFLIYAYYKERQALGCPNIPTGQDCDNANGKAVKGSAPNPQDEPDVLFTKISYAAGFWDRWVIWRIAILAAAVSVMMIYFFLYERVPEENELAIGVFVIAAVIYFTMNFYKFHLYSYVENNINQSINLLRAR